MWNLRYRHWLATGCLALGIATGAFPASLQAAPASAFSRWMDREAVPELQALLSRHPRYRGQRVQVVSGGQDALSEALAVVVNNKLASRDDIELVSRILPVALQPGVPVSIDELDCSSAAGFDYLVRVGAIDSPRGQDRFSLEILDSRDLGKASRSWHWQGEFSDAERSRLGNPAGPIVADGSLLAPWSERDVDAAALALSREFACAVRPQLKTRFNLQWPDSWSLPDLFADTARTSQHLLGRYRELAVGVDDVHYAIDLRLERFRHDTWQLWLIGTPQHGDLAPVQAVTYFKVSDLEGGAAAGPMAASARPQPTVPASLGDALDYIEVAVLGVTQADKGRSRAALQVTLRIGNRADWPIEYAFTLSGGHFNHCVARPDYYRHDRYGHLAGYLDAGASVVRRLVIENAQHRPTPWFGMRTCAGFRDLDGFEAFASQGHKVTDFVRWDM